MMLITSLNKSNLLNKGAALFYAYFFWLMISRSFTISSTVKIPITWYHIPQKTTITTSDFVTIYVKGNRGDLQNFLHMQPVIALDASSMVSGSEYPLTSDQIVLPEEIKLIDYKPSKLMVSIKNTI